MTYNNPLCTNSAKLDAAVQRWVSALYNLEIVYGSEKANVDADFLSRRHGSHGMLKFVRQLFKCILEVLNILQQQDLTKGTTVH